MTHDRGLLAGPFTSGGLLAGRPLHQKGLLVAGLFTMHQDDLFADLFRAPPSTTTSGERAPLGAPRLSHAAERREFLGIVEHLAQECSWVTAPSVSLPPIGGEWGVPAWWAELAGWEEGVRRSTGRAGKTDTGPLPRDVRGKRTQETTAGRPE